MERKILILLLSKQVKFWKVNSLRLKTTFKDLQISNKLVNKWSEIHCHFDRKYQLASIMCSSALAQFQTFEQVCSCFLFLQNHWETQLSWEAKVTCSKFAQACLNWLFPEEGYCRDWELSFPAKFNFNH